MEAHSAATRKNKEWQEKLPVVVLKAEEIMYSKANSEVLNKFSFSFFSVFSASQNDNWVSVSIRKSIQMLILCGIE
jgi:hypothetical protein